MLLYRVLYLPGLFLALPYYLFRMWRRGGYGAGFSNRFGLIHDIPARKEGVRRIWIQAVSVGELMAIEPLVQAFQEDPLTEIVLTTTTSTGFRVARDKFGDSTIWRGIFPMDFWICSSKAWKAIKPDLAVLMEGELWPEHIHQGWQRGVPVVLVNARLSDRSFRRHSRIRRLGRAFYHKLTAILAGSQTDLERFQALEWLPRDCVELSGNLKLDVREEPPVSLQERQSRIREFGFTGGRTAEENVRILLGSSTWPGEEDRLVDSYCSLRERHPGLRLLIVPRHAERRKEIVAVLKGHPVRFHFRTESLQAPPETEIYVADTTGELKELTRSADLVFIGKSLPPNAGGQTPIEAASLGKPLLFGPDMSNFRDVSRRLVAQGAARKLNEASELTAAIEAILESESLREQMGKRAGDYISASRGATRKTYHKLVEVLGTRS